MIVPIFPWVHFSWTRRISHLYTDLDKGRKYQAGKAYQRTEAWYSYTLPSNSEHLYAKHQQPGKTNYGSGQAICNLWQFVAKGSLLESAWCEGKWGWVASLTVWCRAVCLPWKESQDARSQDPSAGQVRAAEQIGRSHNVAALYLACGRDSESQAGLTLVLPMSDPNWFIRRGSGMEETSKEQSLVSGTGASGNYPALEARKKKGGGNRVSWLLFTKTSWVSLSKNLAKLCLLGNIC